MTPRTPLAHESNLTLMLRSVCDDCRVDEHPLFSRHCQVRVGVLHALKSTHTVDGLGDPDVSLRDTTSSV